MLHSIDHHELLVFWVQLLVIYATARLLGSLARRVGLPAVVGELSAGLVLGPSLFGVVWPGGFDWFLPDSEVSSAMLQAVSWLSAAFLLVVAGYETDLTLIRRVGRAAAIVTLGSVALPFAGGALTGAVMPEVFFGDAADRTVFTLFVAVSVAVSALAVVAKVLSDLGLMRRDVGQLTLAVGMANELIGWVILGVISGLAVSGQVSLVDAGSTVFGLVVFLVAALTLGQRGVDVALRSVRSGGLNLSGAVTTTIVAMLVLGVITQALGVEAVLGTFVAGVLLARSRYRQIESQHLIEHLTAVFFAPLFFATAGLRLDLGLLRGEALVWALVLLGVALALKGVGSYASARLAGLNHGEGMVLASGLNARGALEIIIANVGLTLGVFNDVSFTMIVLIPLVTSLVASVGMRAFGRTLEGSSVEQERLEREAALARNLVVREGRLLLPTRGGPNSIVAAQMLHFVWPEELPATLMVSSRDAQTPDITPVENVLHGREVDVIEVSDGQIADLLVAQSRLGYVAVGVGAPDYPEPGSFVSPMVDQLLAEVDIPVVIVRRARDLSGLLPGVFARALVPVVGGRSSRAAEELAANLSARLGTEIVLSNVVYRSANQPQGGFLGRRRPAALEEDVEVAEQVLANASAHLGGANANHRTEIRYSSAPAEDMLEHAEEIEADLIVVGARLRRLGGRPFLGQNVEHLLLHAPQTVVVVVIPEDGVV